ncbi:RNA-directed DNA polymerase, eukaryota [Tanacetum coccineum]
MSCRFDGELLYLELSSSPLSQNPNRLQNLEVQLSAFLYCAVSLFCGCNDLLGMFLGDDDSFCNSIVSERGLLAFMSWRGDRNWNVIAATLDALSCLCTCISEPVVVEHSCPIESLEHARMVRMDCLPTRLNISRRGIDIPSILCPVCGSVTESSSHLFFDCLVEKDNFRKICRWWEVEFMEVHTFDEWVSWIVNLRIPIKHKRLLEGVYNVLWIWSGPISETIAFHILSLGRRGYEALNVAD